MPSTAEVTEQYGVLDSIPSTTEKKGKEKGNLPNIWKRELHFSLHLQISVLYIAILCATVFVSRLIALTLIRNDSQDVQIIFGIKHSNSLVPSANVY